MAKLVRDLFHRGVLTIKQGSTLGQAAVLLDQHRVHALLVVDRDDRPLGIISDYDLLAGEWLSADPDGLATMRKLTVGELMSFPIDAIDANMPLKDAAHLLIQKDVHRLLVNESGRPAGFISISDFVSSIAQQEPARRACVGDVMSDAVLVCRENTPIISAARTMTQSGWRSVLVVDARGKPQGVVSGVDLVPYVENGLDNQLTVRNVMHPALTIDLKASLREAADLMIKNHYHRIVVVDKNDPEAFPLGIMSSVDIVAEMARPGSVWQS